MTTKMTLAERVKDLEDLCDRQADALMEARKRSRSYLVQFNGPGPGSFIRRVGELRVARGSIIRIPDATLGVLFYWVERPSNGQEREFSDYIATFQGVESLTTCSCQCCGRG